MLCCGQGPGSNMRLSWLGFGDADTEDGLRRTLSLLASRSVPLAPNTLEANVLETCRLRITLDGHGQPESVAPAFLMPLQPIYLDSVKGGMATAFTMLDGKPLNPLSFECFDRPVDVGAELCLAELAGFCSELEVNLGAPEACTYPSNGLTYVQGYLVSKASLENALTDAQVCMARIWVPGAILEVYLGSPCAVDPGANVRGFTYLFGNLRRA